MKADVKPEASKTSENVKPLVKGENKQELKTMLEELKALRSMLHA